MTTKQKLPRVIAAVVAAVVLGLVASAAFASNSDSTGSKSDKTTTTTEANTKPEGTSSTTSSTSTTSIPSGSSKSTPQKISCKNNIYKRVINFQNGVIASADKVMEETESPKAFKEAKKVKVKAQKRVEAAVKVGATCKKAKKKAKKGTSGDPYVGNQGNTNPVLSEVRSYQSLVKALVAQPGRGKWYTDDLQQFNGITRDDILRAAKLEKQGHDLRFILVSRTNKTDAEARAQLKAEGVKEVERLPIVRVNGFTNTQGLPNDRMDPWPDDRSQVRVSLGIPVDWSNLSKGLQADHGILTMCGNGWKLKEVREAPPATTVPETHTTQPSVTTTTTAQPPGKPPTTTTTLPVVTTTAPCPPGTYMKDGWCQPVPVSEP